ncbi:HAD family hydrolase [Nakamurella antarctica]|uniref:HAD family hydrolase n=1 Tax=Nakamurella antarctica TaxID=1902245 RepID=A0A3G8ZN00_9ACTN|nr:HAD family hydrolase [Nakamurella antarctica]AZI58712.1 HAD family hydrolase [Nakamurella antarctica]
MAIGHGPVLAYARSAAALLGPDGATLEEAVASGVQRADQLGFFAGDVTDGYGLVHKLAVAAGATPEMMNSAYQESRALLGTQDAPIRAPEDLAAVLARIGATSRVVLVTNAPDIQLDYALSSLGLDGHFHAVHSSAAKPAGLRVRVENWLAEGRVLSIGDIWENDLAPVAELGGQTALVGNPSGNARPDFASPTLPGLYNAIIAWAETDSPVLHSPGNSTHAAVRTQSATDKEHYQS